MMEEVAAKSMEIENTTDDTTSTSQEESLEIIEQKKDEPLMVESIFSRSLFFCLSLLQSKLQ